VLSNVFSQDECVEMFTAFQESPGDWISNFKAKTGHPISGYKQFLSKYLADLLWSRISPFLPKYINGNKVIRIIETMAYKEIKPKTLQPPKHSDKWKGKKDYSSLTAHTLVAYLNDNSTSDLAGGETEMYYKGKVFKTIPKTGSITVIPENWVHRGQEILNGVKHIMVSHLVVENKFFECN
jgi:hypothetical protein